MLIKTIVKYNLNKLIAVKMLLMSWNSDDIIWYQISSSPR